MIQGALNSLHRSPANTGMAEDPYC
jgi:hypothetical protein